MTQRARLTSWLIIFALAVSFAWANPWNIRHYEKQWLEHGYTKFSDFIAKLKVQKRYRYVEDYLELYRFGQYYHVKGMLKNIANLNYATKLKFRTPYKALCTIEDKKAYHKYRLIVFMHIHYLLTRNYLRIGAFYDKDRVRFHDVAFGEHLQKSLKIAKMWYKASQENWHKTIRYATRASKISVDLDCGYLETERHKIMKKEINLGQMRRIYLHRLERKQKTINDLMAKVKAREQNGAR